MKYGFSDICEITYYNDDLSYWGIIVFKDEEHMVVIDFNDEFQEITYYDKDRKRVTVESMDNPYTFVSDDILNVLP